VAPSITFELSAFRVVTRKITRQLVTLGDIEQDPIEVVEGFQKFQGKGERPWFNYEVVRVVPYLERENDPKGRWLRFLQMAVERPLSHRFLACPGSLSRDR
jgi:hypothetical protein